MLLFPSRSFRTVTNAGKNCLFKSSENEIIRGYVSSYNYEIHQYLKQSIRLEKKIKKYVGLGSYNFYFIY